MLTYLSSYHIGCAQKQCEDWVGENVSLAKPPPLMVVVTERGMCGGVFGERAAGLCGSLRV